MTSVFIIFESRRPATGRGIIGRTNPPVSRYAIAVDDGNGGGGGGWGRVSGNGLISFSLSNFSDRSVSAWGNEIMYSSVLLEIDEDTYSVLPGFTDSFR